MLFDEYITIDNDNLNPIKIFHKNNRNKFKKLPRLTLSHPSRARPTSSFGLLRGCPQNPFTPSNACASCFGSRQAYFVQKTRLNIINQRDFLTFANSSSMS